VEKSYVIISREEILGVFEFSSDEEVQKYVNLYQIPVICAETKNEEHSRILRRQIRKELREPVEKLINELWGHIPKPKEDNHV